MIRLNRILHPTDFSERAETALTYALALAARFDSEVHLLHAYDPLAAAAHWPDGIVPTNFDDETRMSAEKRLAEIDVEGAVPEDRLIREATMGPPFVEIVRYAREKEIDLIVLGTHGHSGLTHLLLGSVAENVVRKSPCPVLTVKPDGHQFVMP